MTRHVVGAVADFPDGQHRIVEVAGRQIGVFNVGGEFYALLNRCPHGGAELCKGQVVGLVKSAGVGDYAITRKGEFLRCPWHGWEFEIRTGQSYCEPNKLKIRTFDVAVATGDDLVKGPYVADTYEVAVENDYIVVTV